jgi:hypothetical protein
MTSSQPEPAGNLPPEVSARVRELQKRLLAGWHVAKVRRGPSGWVADVADESGEIVTHLALFTLWPGDEAPPGDAETHL